MTAPPNQGKVNAFGIAIDAVNLETAVDAVINSTKRPGNSYVCLVNAHGIVEGRRNPEMARALQNAALALPDGMPTVWIGRWQGLTHVDRVFGPDLMLKVFEKSQASGERHFLYGGNPGIAQELARSLQSKYPHAKIVGTYTPPFRKLTPAEEAELVQSLEACRPDIVWVGIGSPKQELFMQEYCDRLNVPVMVGVGAAFDFHTGRLKDSPAWVKRTGLQWLHRFLQEPRRLWWRYLKTNTIFILLTLLAILRLKDFSLSQDDSSKTLIAGNSVPN